MATLFGAIALAGSGMRDPPSATILPFFVSQVNDFFWYDWYDGSPAEMVLITEIGTEGDAAFVQMYNPTEAPVDLSGWYLKSSSGWWPLPGQALKPRKTLVLTGNAAAFRSRYGATAALEAPGLRLRDDGDLLTLFSPPGRVDHVAWGGGKDGWHVALANGAFCRPDPKRDTNTALDWLTGRRPSPARAGC